jgi:flagellar motility protein MotE (MotC chaperone)
MRKMMLVAASAALFGMLPPAEARAQDLQDTLGRILQGFQGPGQNERQDERQDQRGGPPRRDGDRRAAYDERWDSRERERALDEAERRLDAQQRQLDEDRRRIEAERRRLPR